MVFRGEGLSAFPSWAERNLAAPYRHDVLDDIFTAASFIAANYKDMVSEFDAYLAPHCHGDLVGPDPEAGGKKNRTQRTAAIGVQKNTHLSRDGLQLLIPEPCLGPQEHLDAALKLLHPFANSPELPLDLKFAAERTACNPEESAVLRANKLKRLHNLAKDLRRSSRDALNGFESDFQQQILRIQNDINAKNQRIKIEMSEISDSPKRLILTSTMIGAMTAALMMVAPEIWVI
jgi:hypothetical protein